MPDSPANTAHTVPAFSLRDRMLIVLLITVAVLIYQTAATWLRWPREPHFSASLLASLHPIRGIAAVFIGAIASLVLGSLVLGRVRYEAGLLTAAAGLAALASRGGTVGAALRSINRPTIYTTFLFETIMLLGVTTLAWLALSLFHRLGWSRQHLLPRRNIVEIFIAGVIQTLITALLVLLLARSDVTKQSLSAVFIAALIGALTAHQTVPVSTSLPFWAGTFLAGIGGFAWAVAHPLNWQIGIPANPLATVSPLGYASLGVAGALFGYWISLRWHAAAEDSSDLDEFDLPPLDIDGAEPSSN